MPRDRRLRAPPPPVAAPRRAAAGIVAAAASLAVAALVALRVLLPAAEGPPAPPRRPSLPAPEAPLPDSYPAAAAEALTLAGFAAAIAPGHPRTSAFRGAILAETGDHSGAADAWQAHLAARPDSAEARYRLALLATRAGNDDDAARWLGEAIRLDPSLPDIQGLLGRALLKLDRVDEAAAVLEPVSGDDRGGAVRLFHLGHARLRQGRDADARDAFRAAVDRAPSYTGAWYGLATAAARLGRDDEAAAAREEFRRLKARDAEAAAAQLERDEGERLRALLGRWYAAAGKMAFDAGDLAAAEACLRRGLAITPDLPDLRQGLDAVGAARSRPSPTPRPRGGG
ncbi:MAG: tetratricopeptide repeat protein [Planctomycetaceae bacterium]